MRSRPRTKPPAPTTERVVIGDAGSRLGAGLGRVLVPLIAAVAGLLLPGAATAELRPAHGIGPRTAEEIKSLMRTAPFDRGTWGLRVADVATGKTLIGINGRRRLFGASTTKNFTTAAALDALGSGHRFRTPVVHTGKLRRSGTLAGDLVLVASGDLTMGGREKRDGTVDYTGFDHTDANEVPGFATLTPQDPLAGLRALARGVKRSGVDRIRGDVVIDDRLWKSQRVNHEVISPIAINDNMVDITMSPTEPGEPVHVETRPVTAAYGVDVQVVTAAPGSPIQLEVGEPHARTATVTGSIPADSAPILQVLRVPRPAFFARSLFIDTLSEAGVRVDAPRVGPNRTRGLPSQRELRRRDRLALRVSPPLSEFVKLISKVSHNPGANTVPFWIGVEDGRRKPNLAFGMRKIRAFAKKVGIRRREIDLIDGQGSPGNAFSPAAMIDLLRYTQRMPYARSFSRALPVKGVDGVSDGDSAADPATGHVFAKNGVNAALSEAGEVEVQAMALAGYARAGKRMIAFDLVVNHVPVLDAEGNPSDSQHDITSAVSRFDYHEAITSLLYESQR